MSFITNRWRGGSSGYRRVMNQILDGVQKGTIVPEQVDMRWNNMYQTYIVTFVDMSNARQRPQAPQFPLPPATHRMSNSIVKVAAPPPEEEGIEDLGVTTEPLIGYRDFLLGTGPQFPHPGLVSRNKAPWPAREPMRAFCTAGALSGHDAPDENCECGIYAYTCPDDAQLSEQNVVWGEVALWGEVLVCETGYRAEFAYPTNLFLRDTHTKAVRWLRDALADSYGVPVYLVGKREGKTAADVISEMLSELTAARKEA